MLMHLHTVDTLNFCNFRPCLANTLIDDVKCIFFVENKLLSYSLSLNSRFISDFLWKRVSRHITGQIQTTAAHVTNAAP